MGMLLLGLAGYAYLRAPNFSGSKVSTMEIEMFKPISPSERHPQALVQARITDPAACASVFEMLRNGRLRMDHKCGAIGSFKIRYSNGETDVLQFSPGHDLAAYEFRLGGRLYRLPRDPFFKALEDAGVDSAKMPATEH